MLGRERKGKGQRKKKKKERENKFRRVRRSVWVYQTFRVRVLLFIIIIRRNWSDVLLLRILVARSTSCCCSRAIHEEKTSAVNAPKRESPGQKNTSIILFIHGCDSSYSRLDDYFVPQERID